MWKGHSAVIYERILAIQNAMSAVLRTVEDFSQALPTEKLVLESASVQHVI